MHVACIAEKHKNRALTKQHLPRHGPGPHHGQRLLHVRLLASVVVHRQSMVWMITPADDVLHDLLHGGGENVLADLDDEEEQHAHAQHKAAKGLGRRDISWQVGVMQQRRALVGFVDGLGVVQAAATLRIGIDAGAHAGGLGVYRLGAVERHCFGVSPGSLKALLVSPVTMRSQELIIKERLPLEILGYKYTRLEG